MKSLESNKSEVTIWLENAAKFPLLPPERVTMIARQIQALPEDSPKRRKLINTLVKHNLRLVVRFVSTFMNGQCHNRWGSPETVDYLQAGSIGLIRAAEKFDPTRGYTFSTYANNWIRSKVSRYNLKTKTLVTISESMSRKLVFYNRNGYIKKRNGQEVVDNSVALPILREVEAALSCRSLNVPNDCGTEMINFIVDTRVQEESEECDIFSLVHQGLDEAGVSALGKEILVAFFVQNEACTKIAERLNISVHKVRRERALALERARRSRTLNGLV